MCCLMAVLVVQPKRNLLISPSLRNQNDINSLLISPSLRDQNNDINSLFDFDDFPIFV
jgi:hypothetical protein